ncbi:3-phosphoshikimate 1-carboxyvinyltransferase [Litorimonas cladophorae]|uniref:3-phosphoshikimate 1-carboxyvinyltransferase n=1 Tax=Litorimonas cladophorae TaxID=1220491 RepID=A0A918KNG8_9PROT|nr:3-phosphoshikimate 1-carboxyvinyltransferase [Litorimonas cladophorae]GGX70357.1 3-phosphoshikimate 1-carboxyvinyltransferase [Litorimonas cladophorae]
MRSSSTRSHALSGTVSAPGDKSISHRAMIFGAMATGTTHVTGLLEGADILSTASVMQALGAKIMKTGVGAYQVEGCGEGGLQTPDVNLDCGNAGTGVRLIMGACAGYKLRATYTGDASLSSRPMNRILDPLREMGAIATAQEGGRLPVTLESDGDLKPLTYTPPVASAQIKSAVLLAAVNTKGVTTITEPIPTRDHTENMLRAFGATIEVTQKNGADVIRLDGPVRLKGTKVNVPGDPSSAAFIIVAALITPGSDVLVENVMMNPTRTGLFDCLTEMGGHVRPTYFRKSGGEVIADIHVKSSKLHGITVPPARAASMIDEYPILAVAASVAKGTTIMDDIAELRVKESDRIKATVALLANNGVDVTELENGIKVVGGEVSGGGLVTTHHDHRIAMSALILGLVADAPVTIDDGAMIATSFPTFFDVMTGLGANISIDKTA